MEQFIKHFERQAEGVWECVSSAELMLPEGRIQVAQGTRFTLGSKFMGVELAALLEDQYEKDRRRDGPSSPAALMRRKTDD